MAKVAVQIIGDPASYNAALGSATASTARFGDAYKTAFAEMDDATLSLAVAQDKLAISTARYGVGTTGAAAATLRFRQETEAMQASQVAAVGSIGKALTLGVTVPVIALGYESTKMAMTFEDSMRLIQTQAGASAGEVGRMTSAILDMVKSGQSFTQTANDEAQALFYVESEGIRGANALDVLKAASAGALIGQASLADTTNALTSVLHDFAIQPKDAASAMAVMNAAIGAGKMHMDDLNAALGTKLLPTAHAVGITLPQITAALAEFTKAGPGAASSATNIQMAIMRMVAPTTAGKAALAEMGIGADQLADELRNGGLPAALATIAKSYDAVLASGNSTAISAAISNIVTAGGGQKGGLSLLMMVQQYGNYMKTLDQTTKDSKLPTFWSDVAAGMNEPSAKIHESLAQMGADMIELGIKIAPLEADVVHAFGAMVGAINDIPGPARDAIGILVAGLAVAGPVMMGVKAVHDGVEVLRDAVQGIGTAAQWMAAKFTASAASTDAANVTMQGAAEKTAMSVESIGAAETALTGQDAAMAARFDAAMVEMQAAAAKTAASVEGIGAAGATAAGGMSGLMGVLGPLGLAVGGGYELGQIFDKNPSIQQLVSSKSLQAQFASTFGEAALTKMLQTAAAHGVAGAANELTTMGVGSAKYTVTEPTAAQARSSVAASIGGKGTLVLADVLSAISQGLVSSTWLSANRDRFANSTDYDAAVQILAASGKSTPATGVAGSTHAVVPLTAAQQVALNPDNTVAQAKLASQDAAALAYLGKERASGKISNATYVAQAAPLEAVVNASQTKANAPSPEETAAAQTSTVEGAALQSRLNTTVTVNRATGALTPAHIAAYDKLTAYYKSEADNSALTKTTRAAYAVKASEAIKTETAEANSAATTYEQTKIAQANSLVAKADSVKGTVAETQASEKALRDLTAAYQSESHNMALTGAQRSQAATSEYTTAAKLNTMRSTYTPPAALSLAAAKAQALAPGYGQQNDMAEVNADEKIKAAAQAAIKSGILSQQGVIQAYNTITDENNNIYNALGTGAIGQVRQASAESITSGLKMTKAMKGVLDERLAQAMAHGGHTANYVGIQGVAVGLSAAAGPLTPMPPVHVHVQLDGHELATVVATHDAKSSTYRAVQTRGVHAGR